jgi:hypothetical protein
MQRGKQRNISAYVLPLFTKVKVRQCSCVAAIAPVLFCPQLKKTADRSHVKRETKCGFLFVVTSIMRLHGG